MRTALDIAIGHPSGDIGELARAVVALTERVDDLEKELEQVRAELEGYAEAADAAMDMAVEAYSLAEDTSE